MKNSAQATKWENKTLTKDILGKWVVDRKGVAIGRVFDVSISSYIEFPYVDGLAVVVLPAVLGMKKSQKKYISWELVSKFSDNKFVLRYSIRKAEFLDIPEKKIFVAKHILDEQLVGIKNRFIGRIDDIEMLYVRNDNSMVLAGFYTGMDGILMRLGLKRYTTVMKKVFGKKEGSNIISWASVKKIVHRPYRIMLDVKVPKQENIYARIIDKISREYIITADDVERIIESVEPEIVMTRFGSGYEVIPVSSRFEPFLEAIENKKTRKHYEKLLKLIKKYEDRYNVSIKNNMKLRKYCKRIFDDMIEYSKERKKLDIKQLERSISKIKSILQPNGKSSAQKISQ